MNPSSNPAKLSAMEMLFASVIEAQVRKVVAELVLPEIAKLAVITQTPSDPSEFLTAAQVARRLAVSVKTVRRMTDAGRLRCSRVGCRLRYKAAEVEAAARVEERRGTPSVEAARIAKKLRSK